jgi:hypothetical protein
MEETVLFVSDNMRCWNSAKAGFTKFNTYLGKIIVTNQRFIFLSSGVSKLGTIFAANLLGCAIIGPLLIGKSLTKGLELEALQNEGSYALTFNEIESIDAIRRWDLAGYMTMQFKGESRSFMQDPFGMTLSKFREIVEMVDNAQIKLRMINHLV